MNNLKSTWFNFLIVLTLALMVSGCNEDKLASEADDDKSSIESSNIKNNEDDNKSSDKKKDDFVSSHNNDGHDSSHQDGEHDSSHEDDEHDSSHKEKDDNNSSHEDDDDDSSHDDDDNDSSHDDDNDSSSHDDDDDILIVDNTSPSFTSISTVSVSENQLSALTLIATDENNITYSISGGDAGSFSLNSTTGVVTFLTAPDFEKKTSYTFTATAKDVAGNQSTQNVTINITDVDEGIEHKGIIYKTVTSSYTGKVWLDRNMGASQVCTSAADSACVGDYYQWGRIADGHEKVTSATTSTLTSSITTGGSDFITTGYADWSTSDSDGSLRSLNMSKTDGSSICPADFRMPTITELKAETIDASSTDFNNFLKFPAAGNRGPMSGTIINNDGYGFILTNSISYTTSYHSYYLQLNPNGTALIGLNGGYATGYNVRCIKADTPADTTSPVFTSTDTVNIDENTTLTALTLSAIDDNPITYSISGTDYESFRIDIITGVVTFQTVPDYETKTSYTFTATAKDGAGNNANKNVTIHIIDIDDNNSSDNNSSSDTTSPIFTSASTVSVNENQTTAVTLVATDDNNITYSISGTDSGSFSLNSTTGVVTFITAPDYETKTSYIFTATARDVAGNNANRNMTINILDVNDTVSDTTAPIFTSASSASVNENQTGALTLVATDDNVITYSISGGDAGSFSLNSATGVVIFLTAPDFETKQNYSFTATATDTSDNNATQSVSITILDVNETVANTVNHNGITYDTVTSPYTGKVWLDRNLGASQVCTSFNDSACYGDYYQWGRMTDGHEKATSSTTTTRTASVTTAGTDFVKVWDNDWSTSDSDGSIRSFNWSKTDGNSICPIGYRVATQTEFKAEVYNSITPIRNNIDAFNSFLKLPSAGHRDRLSAINGTKGNNGLFWTSNPRTGTETYTEYFITSSETILWNATSRNAGMSVRCIKD